VYKTQHHNGIGELLETLGYIIDDFAIPLKKEHLQFLGLYHQQLLDCILQYEENDNDTAPPILNGIFKYWPWSSLDKQVLFLNERRRSSRSSVPANSTRYAKPSSLI
jgi:serine/threonine-protein phosphatase 2A regulatory subunit B'